MPHCLKMGELKLNKIIQHQTNLSKYFSCKLMFLLSIDLLKAVKTTVSPLYKQLICLVSVAER